MIQHHAAGIGEVFGPRVFFGLLAMALMVTSVSGCKRASEPEPVELDVTWNSVDGLTLHGRVYSGGETRPGLLLVHDVGGEHGQWESFAREMEQRGYVSLAFDLRGHGESVSKGDETLSVGSFTSDDWMMAQDDLISAKRMLVDNGADPENLFIVGAGLGGSLAMRHAANDPEIQGLVILSPQRSTRGISIERVVAENRRLPLLFIATEGDSFAANSASALKESSDSYSESRIYQGSTQGVDILASNRNVTSGIAEWLSPILK